MPSLVMAFGDRSTGWVRLQFPYDKKLMAEIKEVPGARWGPMQGVPPGPWLKKPAQHKAWFVPIHSWAVLKDRVRMHTTWAPDRVAQITEPFVSRLRPYQLGDSAEMTRNRIFFLTYDMRVGKTPTSMAAACAMLSSGLADVIVVLYPASVMGSWQDQLKAWANIDLVALQSHTPLDMDEVDELRAKPFLFLGCHYEIFAEREACIGRVVEGRRVVVIADEGHWFQNRKAARSLAAKRFASGTPRIGWDETQVDVATGDSAPLLAKCDIVAWWMLSGTPMRNKPKNLWLPFDLALPGSMGGYWAYAQRYCAAAQDDAGHWQDKGVSNEDELAARLTSISMRRTRRDVAPWLPKADRNVIVCAVSEEKLKAYRRLERQHAPSMKRAMDDLDPSLNDRTALEHLARATTAAKLPTAVLRLLDHAARGVKVVAFGHFKDSVRDLAQEMANERDSRGSYDEERNFIPDPTFPPVFDAGSYQGLSPAERKMIIEEWKAAPEGAILLANTLSSGIGIDLSDAEVGMFLEMEWVPADLRQAEDRFADVHQGKRTVPPVLEYLVVPNTIDEAMAQAVISKIRAIESVVGGDAETSDLSATIRQSGMIDNTNLGLPSTDKETVKAALNFLRDRFLAGKTREAADEKSSIVASVEADWEDDEPASDSEMDDADISF